MATDNLVACYEGIQRVYRNALVSHIRDRLTDKYPADFLEKLKNPFRKDWDKIRSSAEERRQTGELCCPIKDDFDLLGVNHFFNLFDSCYEVLCTEPPGLSAEQGRANKQVLVQWMKTVKNLRDPLSHPSEADFSYEDSFILLEAARRVLLRLNMVQEAGRIRELEEALTGRPLSVEKGRDPLEDRLPPKESIVVHFVGRGDELKMLWEWIKDPATRRWVLAGEGGKGKSALAYKFAAEVKAAAPEPYQIVMWLSAKRRRFQDGGVAPIENPDFFDMDSALNYILSSYGWADEATSSVERKQDRALELLDTFPALVVVDDVDSLEGRDEAVIEFFAIATGKTKSKTLLTTRRQPFGLGYSTTHIGGLNKPDAEEFIRSRCRLLGLPSTTLVAGDVEEIIRVSEASPLYLEDLMRLVAVIPPRDAIREWNSKKGEAARKYALSRELELLPHDAREVLIAACVGPGPVSFPELESITGMAKEQLLNALSELQRLFLVPKPQLIEGEYRYDVNLNTRSLVHEVHKGTDLFRRIESAYQAAVSGITVTGRGQLSSIIRQAVFLVKSKDHDQAIELLTRALEKFPNNPQLMGFLGWVYKASEPPRVTDARETFRRAWQLKCKDDKMYKHWVKMELEEQEWTRAAEAAEKGLKLIPGNRLLLYMAGNARSRLGKELLGGLHKERAADELEKAQRHLEQALKAADELDIGERQLNANIYRGLVLNSEAKGDARRMNRYFSYWMREHPDDPDVYTEWARLSKKFQLEPLA